MAIDSFLPAISFHGLPATPAVAEVKIPPPTNCPTAFPGLRVRFPGATIEVAQAMRSMKDGCDLFSEKLLGIVQAVMTALKPIFDILDLIQKVIACITAIPDAIANANPDPVVQCIPGLAEKINEILAYLFPPIAIPPFIADILCILKTIAECVIQQVESLIELQAQIDRVLGLIESRGAEFLRSAVTSAQVCRVSLVENLAGSMKPIQPLIDIANNFVKLVPEMPSIPRLGDLTNLPLDEIQEVMVEFKAIVELIPNTCVIGQEAA